MRKCKFYASVALATLLAACSNEDFIGNEQQASDLGRPTTKVALAFDEDAATRLSFEKPGKGWQWTFEDGDKIGALLMDEWTQKGCGIENFELTDYVHTNYPFIRQTVNGKTTWNTPEDAAVCEGNYFFYFPYDKTFTHRGLVGWSVNPDQKNYDPETGEYFPMQAIKDNQKWLGYKFVEHANDGVNKLNFEFVPLFAEPKFILENKTGSSLQIERLIIRGNSNGTNEEIIPSGESALLATSMMLAPATGKFGDVNRTWEKRSFQSKTAAMWDHAQRYLNLDAEWPKDGDGNVMTITPTSTVYTLNGVPAHREATYEYTVDFGDKYTVDNLGDVVARLVMPGGLYQQTDEVFEALLYVKAPGVGKRYVVRVDFGRPQTQGGTETSAWDDIVGDQANHFLRPGLMPTFKASFDATALQDYAIADFKVATTEELKWLLEESEKNTGNKPLIVTTFGKRVELNKEIADLLKANPQLRLYINGDITLAGDAPEDAINLLYFDIPSVKTDLHIASKQVANVWQWTDPKTNVTSNVSVLKNCTIDVLVGGSLDTKTHNITIEVDVTNAGTVLAANVVGNVANKKGASFTADIVTGNVKNEGVAAVGTVGNNVNNSGDLTINNVGNKLANSGHTTAMGGTLAEVDNTGTIDIEGETTIPALEKNQVKGIINVNVTSKISGDNLGTINVNSKEGKRTVLTPIDYNKGGDVLWNRYLDGKFGVINVNDADLSQLSTTDMIYNDGEINVIGASHVIVEHGGGIIDITKADKTGGYQAKIVADYDATTNSMSFRYRGAVDTDTLKKLISTQNYGKVPVIIVFEVSATQDKDLTGANVQKILVKKGAVLSLEGTFNDLTNATNVSLATSYDALRVEKDATLQILNTKELSTSATIDAYINGLMRVENSGKVLGTGVTVKGTGTVENGSANENFEWTPAGSDDAIHWL